MREMKKAWRLSLASGVATLTGSLLLAGVASASTSRTATPIGPNQTFGALVNGKKGVSHPVPIQMACFGPVTPGETGHPMKGQTVRVFAPKGTKGPFGNTGANGTEIGAFFGAPPPSTAAASSSGPVWFHNYVTKPIPTSEVLPCYGTGHVIFVPLPFSPGSEVDVVVPVAYVGQP
ncbi:MAG: hypothetical protein ACLQK4_06650 [Acidimicrobiales bacterium]|jgi:hypothetical protein